MSLPSIETLFLETPLYEEFSFTEEDGEYIFSLSYFKDKVDAFCPLCNKHSTYKGENKPCIINSSWEASGYEDFVRFGSGKFVHLINKIHHIDLVCTRNEDHKMQVSIYIKNTDFFKIGQYPSIADLSLPDLKKYREIMGVEKFKEFTRGVGLITHGVGVGAYVYLRRIFEDLIEEAHSTSKEHAEWDEDKYVRARMDDKIDLLKESLPPFLVLNRKLYGVLSKGIHELTENECLKYFPTVKLAIELILDEKLEQKRRKDKIESAQKSLNKIQSDLK